MKKGLDPKTTGAIIKTLRKAKRMDLVGTVIKAAANQAETVNYLKQAGILPPDVNVGDFPAIGNDETWQSLDDHPEVTVKRDTIATLLKAKRADLANIVAQTSTKELFGK